MERKKNCYLHSIHRHAEDFERYWHRRAREAEGRLHAAQQEKTSPERLGELEKEAQIASQTASWLMRLVQHEQGAFYERMLCGGGCAVDVTIAPDNETSPRIYFLLEGVADVFSPTERTQDRKFVFFDPSQARRVAYALLALAERKTIRHNFDYEEPVK